MAEEVQQSQTPSSTNVLNAGGGAPPAQPGPAVLGPEWVRSLPEELRNDPGLTRYKDLTTFARSFKGLESKIGKSVTIPGDDATPEEQAAFLARLRGVDSPDKYDLKVDRPKLADGIPYDEKLEGAFLDKFKQMAFDHGMSNKQAKAFAQDMLNWYGEQAGGQWGEMQKGLAEAGEKNIATLKQEFGYDFDRKVAVASQMVGKLAEDIPGLAAFLDQPQNVNNPVLVKLFAVLGEMAGEDVALPSGHAPSEGDVTNAKEQLSAVMRDPVYWDDTAAGHKEAVQKALRLNQVIAGGGH